MIKKIILIILFVLLNNYADCKELEFDEKFSKVIGSTVVISCPIDVKTCGDLHSVNWFKGEKRIAVVLGNGTNIASDYKERLKIDHSPKGPDTKITISNLQVKDEDKYICDTTYFMPQENCSTSSYRVNLLIKVIPKDTYVLYDKQKITTPQIIGPLQEEHELRALCVVEHTRPKPKITWYRGDMILPSHGNYSKEENGIFLYNAEELTFVLSREDLNKDIECRVESDALDKVISYQLKLDLRVRPTKIELSGVKRHVVEGSNVILECKVFGGRPAANITWTNSSIVIDDKNNDRVKIHTEIESEADGSYRTVSQLRFVASRFEGNKEFRCDADNIIMRDNRELPIHAEMELDVHYAPAITVSPNYITVNEGDRAFLNCEYISNPATLTSVRWLRNDEVVNTTSQESRFDGGNIEHVPLTILQTRRDDHGNYTCELTNSIGTSISEAQIHLEVQYVPTVQVQMVPVDQVIENDETNVTLFCNVINGNPPNLLKVKWYANSTILKELPDCNTTNGDDLCHVDPSKLLLESIGRNFFLNYSCKGYNLVGWGPTSEDKELVVYYEPGPAIIQQAPNLVIKKKSVTLSCLVEDLGYPIASDNSYKWFRNNQPISNVKQKSYTMELVSLNERGIYSCYAYNNGGNGIAAIHNLTILAPPNFIKALGQYTGVLNSSKNMSLTCRVECYPKCSITWKKDGIEIDFKSTNLYYTVERYMPADESTGDFESAQSILHFNLSAWTNQRFDKNKDNGNYSCHSTKNEAGPGVESATYLSIEYAPENTTVPTVINVTEGEIPKEFDCTAVGNPEPEFFWRYKNVNFTHDKKFKLQNPVNRNDTGLYECVSHNKHGIDSAEVQLNVQYKPTCEIVRRDIDNEDTLICTGYGNPEDYSFQWFQVTENDTTELIEKIDSDKSSHYILNEDFPISKTYQCIVTNSIGPGIICDIEVAGQLTWWQRWDRTTLIILIASIIGVLIAVIIICCIIICVCRRRRKQDKYHTDVFIRASQSVLLYQTSSPISTTTTPIQQERSIEAPKSPPKWPLRPGVMVHVKNDTKQNLCASRTSSTITMTTESTKSNMKEAKNELEGETHKSSSSASSVLDTTTIRSKIENNQENGHENVEDSIKKIKEKHSIVAQVNPSRSEEITDGDRTNPPPILPRRNIALNSTTFRANNNQSDKRAIEIRNDQQSDMKNETKNDNNRNDDNDDDNITGVSYLKDDNDNEDDDDDDDNLAANGLFRKIFGEIFSKDDRSVNQNSFSSSVHLKKFFGISRFLFRKQTKLNDSQRSNLFVNEHRIKGIRCSGNVITYKKSSSVPKKSSTNDNCAQLESTTETAPKNEQNSTKKIHGKASTLRDPLTEPGEYENLPFHGLQTAPNKLITSSNFNNTNIVRVAPRQKQIDNTQHNQSSRHYQHQQHQQQQQHQQLLQYQLQQNILNQTNYSTPSNHNTSLVTSNSIKSKPNHNDVGIINTDDGSTSKKYPSANHNHHHNSNDSIRTSYTAYYNQLQRQYCASNFQSGKYFTDYPYTVQNTISSDKTSVPIVNNPFRIDNRKKYNTDNIYHSAINNENRILSDDKKFYSLKSLNQKRNLHSCPTRSSFTNTTQSNKCKRHHSFAGGGGGCGSDGNSNDATVIVQQYAIPHQNNHQQSQSIKINFYEPPAYENLTDSIQIHEHNPSPIQNVNHPSSSSSSQTQNIIAQHCSHNKRHHHHQFQNQQMTKNERLSIYRSDSGISNSSYECITPIPAPRQLLQTNNSILPSKKKSNNIKHYMNVSNNDDTIIPPPISSSATTTTATTTSLIQFHSKFSPASDSPTICPIPKQSNKCNCKCDNNDGNDNCEIHCDVNNQINNSTNKDMQQQKQLESMQYQHQLTNNANNQSSTNQNISSRRRKLSSASLISLEHISNNTNPFLMTISSSSSGLASCSGNGEANNENGDILSSSSSTTSRCRQKIVLPKDNFLPSSPSSPTTSASASISGTNLFNNTITISNNTNTNPNVYDYSIENTKRIPSNNPTLQKVNLSTNRKQKSRGYTVRPAKFPLRKHHSFHFQISQTVAAVKFKKKVNNYVQNGGSLILKPFINENSAFKPISPAKCDSSDSIIKNFSNNNDLINVPRICGTSLKRHMSNIETTTYNGNRYTVTNNRTNITDGSNIANNQDEIYSDDDTDLRSQLNDENDDKKIPSSSSSSSKMINNRRARRLNFDRINSIDRTTITAKIDDTSPTTDEFDDLTINSDSEQFRRRYKHGKKLSYPIKDNLKSESIVTDYDAIIEKNDIPSNFDGQKYGTHKINETNI